MDESIERSVLKVIQRKFPVCNVIDARTYDGGNVADKCDGAPRQMEIKLGKVRFSVTICTGSFNVYVLKIEDLE